MVFNLQFVCSWEENVHFMYESALHHFCRCDDCQAFYMKRSLERLLLPSRITFWWVSFVVWWLLPLHSNILQCTATSTVASRIWSHEWCLSAGKDPPSCSPVDLIVSSNSKRWRWGIRDAIHSPPEETITLAWLTFSSFDVHVPQRRSTVLILTKSLSGRRKYSHLF